MLAFLRRFMLVLLAVTLSSQLVEAQTLVCERMTTVAASHEGHAPMQQMDPAAQEDDATAPVSPDCVLAASCINAPAILVDSGPGAASTPEMRALPEIPASAPFRSLRPDLPPPRI
jgi:hypothetical protein